MKLNPNQTEANITLVAHRGATDISRAGLATLSTPEGTDTHIPVPHSLLMDCIEETLNKSNLQIEQQEYAVMSNGGQKLFGVLKLKGFDTSEYRMALGVRASNDKSIPLQMIAGANVFVCDNMSFNSEVICMKRRHTKNLDLQAEVTEGVQRAIDGYRSVGSMIDTWKEIPLSDLEAKGLIVDAACKEIMPLHLVPNVVKEWLTPSHKEFEGRNTWSLHNAFTESFKALKGHIAMQAATDLSKFLQEAIPVV